MITISKNLSNYLELIWYQTITSLRSEATKTVLNFGWWIIEPVIYMLVFYIVFGFIFKRGSGEDFIPFLLCGLVVWKWVAMSITASSFSISTNISLMQQVYVPKLIFPIITIVQQLIRFLVVLLILVLFLNIYGLQINFHYLELIPLILIQIIFLASIGFLLACIVPILPDVKMVIPSALQLLFFMSGIFFPVDAFPDSYQAYFNLNPIFVLIEAYRDILMRSSSPDWGLLIILLLFSTILLYFSVRLIEKFDRIYPKIIN